MGLNIQQIYDYAKLSTLAYVDLSGEADPRNLARIINLASHSAAPGNTARLPESLGIQMLNPVGAVSADITGQWTILDPYFRKSEATGHSDPASGFAAMLVQNDTTGAKVLAIPAPSRARRSRTSRTFSKPIFSNSAVGASPWRKPYRFSITFKS